MMRRWIVATLAVAGLAVAGLLIWQNNAAPRWSPQELALLQSLSLAALKPPAADPSNAVADDPRAAALGKQLFFDPRLSGSGQVACATCHIPARYFTDGRTLGQGAGTLSRHTMSLIGVSHTPWLTWDGKADSVWAQALGPLEHPAEHGSDRTFYARQLAALYGNAYVELFGPLPALADTARFPAHASPNGDGERQAAWDAMAPADQAAVNRVFANMGKVLAAYQRGPAFAPQPGRFDQYVDALSRSEDGAAESLLSPDEAAGLRLFVGKAQCINCHNGPLFANGEFHNTAVPPSPGLPLDMGRRAGVSRVQADPFNCLGPFSDAAPEQCVALRFLKAEGDTLDGSFKTPTLRNVAETAPYMHAGQYGTLGEVLDHYTDGSYALVGHNELTPLGLTEDELAQLEAFLTTLTGAPPALQ